MAIQLCAAPAQSMDPSMIEPIQLMIAVVVICPNESRMGPCLARGVYDEDVPREEDCGEQQHHVRQGDGSESVGDAQQVEADNGDGDADDDAEVHSSTQYDEGQQWRHDDV